MAPEPNPRPARVGRFVLVEPLARGGSSELFRVRHRGAAGVLHEGALKLLHVEHRGDPAHEALLVNEATLGARLSHPSLVLGRELVRDGDVLALLLPLVRGVSLRRLHAAARARGTDLGGAYVAHVGAELCLALAALHDDGLVHGDLSPGNVLCAFDGHVLLADFALTREAGSTPSIARSGLGTSRYLAPEVAAGSAATPASDLFSLGAVLFELLAGEPPLGPLDGAEAMLALAAWSDEARPRLERRGEIPDRLAKIVDGALAADPAARPDARALCALFELFRGARGTALQLGPARFAEVLPDEQRVQLERRADDEARVRQSEEATPVPTPTPTLPAGRPPELLLAGLLALAGVAVLIVAALLSGCAAAPEAAASPIVELPPPPPAPPPAELPAPPPPPTAAAAELPAPDDPLELLYAHRLAFSSDGTPLITVRIEEEEKELRLVTRGQVRLLARGPDGRPVPVAGPLPPGPLTLRVSNAQPAELLAAPVVAEHKFRDKAGVRETVEAWQARGQSARVVVDGGVYGIAGRVLDTRRYAVIVGEPTDRRAAKKLSDELARRFGVKPTLRAELVRRPTGTVEAYDAMGVKLAAGAEVLVIEPLDEAGITVLQVEKEMGYATHGREDRTYRGRLFATVGADGQGALVNVLPLEELLRGIVPSELYATAPLEALKAQAVTARGEVLAKIGARHVADPWLLCAEQHCQVHKGLAGEHPNTDRAIAATKGEALFAKGGGGLVDSVYSSTCGGHTEDNEIVWGGPADPSLRGVPDWAGTVPELVAFTARVDEEEVPSFLGAELNSFCRRASLSRPDKYRWEKRFTAAEVDGLVAALGVGHVTAMAVQGRGSSGRAVALAITGDKGAAVVKGELNVRKLFKNLNSALVVIEREGPAEGAATGWLFRGGGWGHGVGMCQMGAIGRAEAGFTYRQILGHYYNGAETVRLY